MTESFREFGFSVPVLEALTKKGFEEPTPIQALAIPKMLNSEKNLIAKARTGTGKTAAFGLPLVDKLSESANHIRALILVPTRELAVQVAGEIASFSPGKFPRIATVYGGASMGEQLRRLSRGVDVVVGTPGRVLDHIDRKSLDLSKLEWLVLDEADEMLDMGFIEDIEKVMDASNPEQRVVLFSATMPYPIMKIAKERLGDFEFVEDVTKPVDAGLTDQIWLEVRERDKLEALCRIVDTVDEFYGLVFCHTKIETDSVARALSERGYAAEALHGDVSQDMRERTLARFREKKTLILVATDVAARGIDVECLTHVINFNLPFDPDSYTHRIGRTGRAGCKGTAITFVTPDEYRRLSFLRRSAGDGMHKGEVPSIAEVIAAKKAKIKAKAVDAVENILKKESSLDLSAFYSLADELLLELEPREALAALAVAAYATDLDPRRYGEVKDVSSGSDKTARLCVSIGKKDGAWPRDIASIVKQLTGLPDRLVDDIEVLDSFSFVTVPSDAAERAVKESGKKAKGPSIHIAKGTSSSSGRRDGSKRFGGGHRDSSFKGGSSHSGRSGSRRPASGGHYGANPKFSGKSGSKKRKSNSYKAS